MGKGTGTGEGTGVRRSPGLRQRAKNKDKRAEGGRDGFLAASQIPCIWSRFERRRYKY